MLRPVAVRSGTVKVMVSSSSHEALAVTLTVTDESSFAPPFSIDTEPPSKAKSFGLTRSANVAPLSV